MSWKNENLIRMRAERLRYLEAIATSKFGDGECRASLEEGVAAIERILDANDETVDGPSK